MCWVRPHEAKAVIAAASLKRDTPVEDSRGRHAGFVQYFPPTSPAATRFRSVTRLLRLSGGGDGREPAASGPAQSDGSLDRGQLEDMLNRATALVHHGTGDVAEADVDGADRRALEAAFHKAMVRIYERARDEANYHAGLLLKMVTEQGGLATARQLLHNPVVSDGFTALWERGRVDLTAEAVVIQPKFRPLFTDQELAIASNRVVEASSHVR